MYGVLFTILSPRFAYGLFPRGAAILGTKVGNGHLAVAAESSSESLLKLASPMLPAGSLLRSEREGGSC